MKTIVLKIETKICWTEPRETEWIQVVFFLMICDQLRQLSLHVRLWRVFAQKKKCYINGDGLRFGFQIRWLHCAMQDMFTLHTIRSLVPFSVSLPFPGLAMCFSHCTLSCSLFSSVGGLGLHRSWQNLSMGCLCMRRPWKFQIQYALSTLCPHQLTPTTH